MDRSTLRTAACAIALFALGATTNVVAQTLPDSPLRKEHKRADRGGAPGMEVIACRSTCGTRCDA